MPLSERARIEVYLPDLPTESSQNLLNTFETEFTYALGGCTIIRNLDGSYFSRHGLQMRDRVNVIFADTPFGFDEKVLSRYSEELRRYAFDALEEESASNAINNGLGEFRGRASTGRCNIIACKRVAPSKSKKLAVLILDLPHSSRRERRENNRSQRAYYSL